MRVECRHCGAFNDAEPPVGGSETVVCQACGRPFTVYHEDATLDVAGVDARTLLAPLDAALPAASGSWDDEGGENTVAVEMESLNIPRASQLEADEPGQQTALISPDQRIPHDIPLDPDDGYDDSLARLALGGGDLWRIRNDRGAVYELDSLEAAANWLEGRSNLGAYGIARGPGPFKSPEAYPELMARLQAKGGPLRTPAPEEVEGAQTVVAPEHHRPASSVDVLMQSPLEQDQATAGLGMVLWTIVAGAGVTAAALVLGLQMGATEVPAPPAAASPAAVRSALPEDDRAIRALAAYKAEKFTAAAQLFEELSVEPSATAEVHRLLAASLHRTGRQREAEVALGRYRALLASATPDQKGE